MQPDPSKSNPQGNPRPHAHGSHEAKLPLVTSEEVLNERLAAIFFKIADLVRKDTTVSYGFSLTPHDLRIAALNGMSTEINYLIPPAPCPAHKSSDPTMRSALRSRAIDPNLLIVAESENPILFDHIVAEVRRSGNFSQEQISQLEKSGLTSVAKSVYVEYAQLLQDTARFLKRNSESLGADVAEYLAAFAAKELTRGIPPMGTLPQLILCSGHHPDGILLSVMQTPVVQRLAPGAKVLWAGAGYNVLQDLPAMKSAEHVTFVLNDRDPFVAQVLERTLALFPIPNVSFVSGEMSSALNKGAPFDAAIVSNVTTATDDEIKHFAHVANQSLVPGSPVHICQVEEPLVENAARAETWIRNLKENAFLPFLDRQIPGYASSVFEIGQNKLLKMSGQEIVTALEQGVADRKPRPFRHFVGILDPKDQSVTLSA